MPFCCGKITYRAVCFRLAAFGFPHGRKRLAAEINDSPGYHLVKRFVCRLGIRGAFVITLDIKLFVGRTARREPFRPMHYNICTRAVIFELEVVRAVNIVAVENKHFGAIRDAPEAAELLKRAVYTVRRGGIHPNDKSFTGLYLSVLTCEIHGTHDR